MDIFISRVADMVCIVDGWTSLIYLLNLIVKIDFSEPVPLPSHVSENNGL